MANRESKNVTETVGALEADYLMLLEKSIDAIVVVDQDRFISFVNPAAEAILDGKAEELVGELFRFPLGADEITEVAITRNDGETVLLEMRVVGTEWRGEDAYFISLHDITERRQAEKAFRESEGRYRTLTGNLNVGVYRNTPGPKGRFIEVNPAHFGMLGYESKEEFLAVDVADLYQNPEDRRKLSEKLSSLGYAKEELELKKKDGTSFTGLVSAVAVKDENGEVRYFDGIIEDISERKRAENLLKESEKRYRNLVEMAPVGIITLDTKGMVTSCNSTGLNLSGRSRDEVVGKHFTKTGTIRTEDAAKYAGVFSSILSGKRHAPVEYIFDCKDGAIGWGEAHFGLLEDDGGNPAGVQVILRDITERKRTEELTRIQRDLGLALSATDSLDETMRLCFEAAIKVTGMDGGGLYLVDRDSGELNLAFHKRLSPEFVASVSHYDAESINARIVMKGEPVYSRYDEMNIPLNEVDRQEQTHFVATVPVFYEGQVIACLVISSHTLDDIPLTTRNALETIASQIGSSIARVQAKEALREGEERYRLLVENANEIILVAQDGVIKYVNPKNEDVMGYSAHEVVSRPFMSFIHPDDRDAVIKRYEGRIKGEEVPHIYSFRAINKDSNIRWMQVNSELINWEGRPATLSLLTDVTESKRAEEALQESERKYRLLTENSNAAISVIGRDGTFLLLNNVAAAEMAGKPDDFIGESLYDILPGEVVDGPMETIRAVIESGKGQTNENLVRLPTGDKWIFTNVQPIIEPDGSVSSVQVVSQDVTEYKKIEEKLRQSLDRENLAIEQGRLEMVDTILHNIGNAISSVITGTGTVKELVDRLSGYLTSLADAIKEHESSFSDYVKNDPQGQKVAPFIVALADEFRESSGLVKTVKRVMGQAEHVDDIIRTVKEVSGKPYRKDIDLKKAVENAITVLQDSIENRNIKISHDCNNAPEEISTHESQFHQMLVNLIKNSMEAIDALKESGDMREAYFIRIACHARDDSLILEVTDNGIGIEKNMLETIFRPGFTDKKSGTGLGLHSIGNFVKGYGGHVQALSDGIGKGATMWVVLPLNEE
ncbi:PAS domain S-box protein [Candidatus Poribacteria bacterium]